MACRPSKFGPNTVGADVGLAALQGWFARRATLPQTRSANFYDDCYSRTFGPSSTLLVVNSIHEISAALREALSVSGLKQQDLREAAGVSRQTLANVLKGTEDYKLSTLLALADRLGHELVLLPKAAARGLQAKKAEPVVETVIDQVRKRLASPSSTGKS